MLIFYGIYPQKWLGVPGWLENPYNFPPINNYRVKPDSQEQKSAID